MRFIKEIEGIKFYHGKQGDPLYKPNLRVEFELLECGENYVDNVEKVAKLIIKALKKIKL